MSRRAWLAGVLSFSVYLLPLVGPHAFVVLGEWLARGDRPAAWRAAELAVALGLQVAADAIWYWIHSVGGARDSVYVLPTGGSQTPVFRRYLPTYARSGVAFPARDLFAYTEWDGRRAEVVVQRLPDS